VTGLTVLELLDPAPTALAPPALAEPDELVLTAALLLVSTVLCPAKAGS
jgi:hypothetical protein